jgi:pimeloyl-ACP methyl ester carboxylesterase
MFSFEHSVNAINKENQGDDVGDMTLGMRRHGTRLAVIGLGMVLVGGLLASWIQTWSGIRVSDVRFTGTGGTAMSALLYVPATASAKSPAPGVLAVHGYFNSREAQSGFAIEFARRGYVVLALDQTGHGYSDPPAFSNGFGGADGLAYLRSLDFVDKNNIGLEGHSMGGWTVLNAAAAFPDGYKSVVLEGSSTGAPFAPEGSTTFPRNLAVVFARFDEFSAFMWGAPVARQVAQSQKLKTAFGVHEAVQTGRLYGSIEQGSARILHTPAGTHPLNHLSTEAIGHSIDWFQRTLQGGMPIEAADQIWPWKELGTTIAFAGCIVLMLGIFEWSLGTGYFAPLASASGSATARGGLVWWLALSLSIALPVLTFFPFMQLGERIAPASALWPQGFTNQIAVWALLNAVLITGLSSLPGNPRRTFQWRPWRSLVLAGLTVASAYATLAVADFLFTIDFRFWFIALKLLSRDQAVSFLAYLIPFAGFFLLVLRALHTNLPLKNASPALQYTVNIVALAGGFALFVLAQYGLLFSTDRLLSFYMNDNLRTIVAIQFVPLMAIVAIISTFAFRRTDSYVPGAFVCALFVTWYIVAGQATHVAR